MKALPGEEELLGGGADASCDSAREPEREFVRCGCGALGEGGEEERVEAGVVEARWEVGRVEDDDGGDVDELEEAAGGAEDT